MAKIVIEFDTIDKTMACTVEGQALSNVVGCSIFRGYGKKPDYACEIMQEWESDTEDMRAMTRIVAAATPAGAALAAAGAAPASVPGFVVAPPPEVDDALAAELIAFWGRGGQ